MEIEAKYEILRWEAWRAYRECRAVAGFSMQDWELLTINDCYLDTATQSVQRAGYALRIRTIAETGATYITLKSSFSESQQFSTRQEVEFVAPTPWDVASWGNAVARETVLSACAGQPLVEQFTLRQHRNVCNLLDSDQTAIGAFSLDAVQVHYCSALLDSFCVLEVELTDSGTLAHLEQIDSVLRADIGLRPALVGKLARARRATRGKREPSANMHE